MTPVSDRNPMRSSTRRLGLLLLVTVLGLPACDLSTEASFPNTEIFTVTLQIDGGGSGRVTSFPSGIACATGGQGTCSVDFLDGANVVLSPNPDDGSVFTGWSGSVCSGTDACTFTVRSAVTITATFETEGG